MFENIKKYIGYLGAALLFVITLIIGSRLNKSNAETQKLEKQVDNQKKAITKKDIEAKNLSYQLQNEELTKNRDKVKAKIKAKIKTKLDELSQNKTKLDEFTKELDNVRTVGEGKITKIE